LRARYELLWITFSDNEDKILAWSFSNVSRR
jgi:hypothetical protein